MAAKISAQAPDAAIPLVFPDYQIKVSERVKLPDFEVKRITIGGRRVFSGFKFKGPEVFDGKLGDLGHAGVLLIRGGARGAKGLTKYFEYGRYDKAEMGIVRPVGVPDVTLGSDGRATKASLARVMQAIATKAGHGTRIAAVYIEAPGKFNEMLRYAQGRLAENESSKREAYSIWTNSCLHFAVTTAQAGGVAVPAMVDPRPTSYIEELRGAFPDLDYDPRSGEVTMESAADGVPEWAGKTK